MNNKLKSNDKESKNVMTDEDNTAASKKQVKSTFPKMLISAVKNNHPYISPLEARVSSFQIHFFSFLVSSFSRLPLL